MIRKVGNANVLRFSRFLLVIGLTVVVLVGLLALAGGCGALDLAQDGDRDVRMPVQFHEDVEAVDIEADTVETEHVEAETAAVDQLTVIGESDLGQTVFHGDVEIQGTLVVTEDLAVTEDINAGGEIEENVSVPPPPEDDGDDDDDNGELIVILLPPFVGLPEESVTPPTSCTILTVGNFQVEVKLMIEGGVAPYAVRFQNYYGSVTEQSGDIDEEGKFDLLFDASVPTAVCVSSLLQVTDANGETKNVFFYTRVR